MLIEGLGSATFANGVMRIETLQRNAKGEDISGVELLIPINRVATIASGIQAMLEKAEEAAQAPSALELN